MENEFEKYRERILHDIERLEEKADQQGSEIAELRSEKLSIEDHKEFLQEIAGWRREHEGRIRSCEIGNNSLKVQAGILAAIISSLIALAPTILRAITGK